MYKAKLLVILAIAMIPICEHKKYFISLLHFHKENAISLNSLTIDLSNSHSNNYKPFKFPNKTDVGFSLMLNNQRFKPSYF